MAFASSGRFRREEPIEPTPSLVSVGARCLGRWLIQMGATKRVLQKRVVQKRVVQKRVLPVRNGCYRSDVFVGLQA